MRRCRSSRRPLRRTRRCRTFRAFCPLFPALFLPTNTIRQTHKNSKGETQVVLPPALRIAQRFVSELHSDEAFLHISAASARSHLGVGLSTLIGMEAQREALVGLPNVLFGGGAVHFQHRVQVYIARTQLAHLASAPRADAPSTARRGFDTPKRRPKRRPKRSHRRGKRAVEVRRNACRSACCGADSRADPRGRRNVRRNARRSAGRTADAEWRTAIAQPRAIRGDF